VYELLNALRIFLDFVVGATCCFVSQIRWVVYFFTVSCIHLFTASCVLYVCALYSSIRFSLHFFKHCCACIAHTTYYRDAISLRTYCL